ncbi:hypothetical protein An07g07525 [Aspergillus niger]|uniref:Uncharacterized protein n=2 Tax=Aspergillus niger TaxID=5061 RepID=A5AAV3_ASPNC|nr:hypothetical protein An07g07525 [Aspergillus niger]CAK39568.1 hypothetical protein An07g07525 [Aspergillus niger]
MGVVCGSWCFSSCGGIMGMGGGGIGVAVVGLGNGEIAFIISRYLVITCIMHYTSFFLLIVGRTWLW